MERDRTHAGATAARDLAVTVALAGLSGALYYAAFPPLDRGTLAFVCLVPLLSGLGRGGRLRAFAFGWLSGTFACTALVAASIFEAARRYFAHSPWFDGAFALIVPQLYGAPYFGLFALAARSLLRPQSPAVRSVLCVPAAWVLFEFVRANVGHGAPWVLLAHSQHAAAWLLQISDVTGAYGVSFLVVMANVAIVHAVQGIAGTRRLRDVASGLIVLACVGAVAVVYGAYQTKRWQRMPERSLRLALVQPNVPLSWRRSARSIPIIARRLQRLTAGTLEAAPDLVVWPENAVGFLLPANADLLRDLSSFLPPESHLLLGAPRLASGGAPRARFHNSAFLVARDGTIGARYDKLRLTPFAETSPWTMLPLFHRRFADEDTYLAGDEWTVFDLRQGRFATLICYEAIYPDLARQFVARGAELLVNISNDDWFGQRPALWQHLHAALFRAVENRRYLVRVTNTGVSAVIDPTGRVVRRAPAGVPYAFVSRVGLIAHDTFYSRWGDVFAWACILILAADRLRRRTAP